MTPTLLAHDPDDPICHNCATAYALTPRVPSMWITERRCAVCGIDMACATVRDYHPPGRVRPSLADLRDWQRPLEAPATTDPDDYAELETVLAKGER